MWDRDSERFMIAAAVFADAGGHRTHARNWNPNVSRFFPYRLRDSVYDVCGYLYHLNVLPGSVYYGARHLPMTCDACRWSYGGHRVGIERGRRLINGNVESAGENPG